ncbi:MAG: hypothetical protein PHQ23_17000, partial [Candidatus Wallbacteria bacterium]|nr:hypothetical protein [Candidatus Wallbacteria bacterium]
MKQTIFILTLILFPRFSLYAEQKLPVFTGEIVFVSDRDGNREIYAIKSDGTGERRITSNEVEDINPRWAPDKSKIVYSSYCKGTFEICVITSIGGSPSFLTHVGYDCIHPSFSRDGKKIVFCRSHDLQGLYFELYMMNADGTGMERMTRYQDRSFSWRVFSPDYSPNGDKIIFSFCEEDLYVRDLKSGTDTKLMQ